MADLDALAQNLDIKKLVELVRVSETAERYEDSLVILLKTIGLHVHFNIFFVLFLCINFFFIIIYLQIIVINI